MVINKQFKKYTWLLIVLGGISLFISCTRISGTYVANYTGCADTLKIFSNNKFERRYYEKDFQTSKRNYIDTGSWTISNGTIYFHDWIERGKVEETDLKGQRIIFGTEIQNRYFFGKTRLLINDDLEYYYKKE